MNIINIFYHILICNLHLRHGSKSTPPHHHHVKFAPWNHNFLRCLLGPHVPTRHSAWSPHITENARYVQRTGTGVSVITPNAVI